MTYPRYKEYKHSGVDWLGEVPENWNISKTSRFFKIAMGQTILKENLVYEGAWPVFSATDGDHYFGYVNEPDIRLNIGDLVIPARGNSIGAIKILTEPATTTQTTIWCKLTSCKSLTSKYIYYFMKGNKDYLFNYTQTAIPQITVEQVSKNPILVPTLLEQIAIAAFLDRETTKIDKLIPEKKRLINLLKEKRQSVISHAVTKGLDPNVPMKDSGIKWLANVPVHWSLKRLRFILELNPSKSEISQIDKNTLVSFLPMENIGTDGSIRLDHEKIIRDVETGYTFFRNGDVTIAKITPCFENGKGAVMENLTNSIGFGTTELIVARPMKDKILAKYLYWIFATKPFMKLGEACMYGAGGQKRLPDEFILNFQIGIPSIVEQGCIVNYLEYETAKIDALIAESQKAIALLQERRRSLISAAVTGKIDVRELHEKEFV